MGQNAFEGIEPGLSDACRKSCHGRLQYAADAVAFCGGLFDGGLYFDADGFIQDRKSAPSERLNIALHVLKPAVRDSSAPCDMGSDPDALLLQRQLGDRAGCHERRRQTAAEMPAAAVILVPSVLAERRIIRMPGARQKPRRLIISAADILIRDQNTDRRTRRVPLEDTAHDPKVVRLHTTRRNLADGPAQGQLLGDVCLVHLDSGRKSIENHADLFAVALSEKRYRNAVSKGVLHAFLRMESLCITQRLPPRNMIFLAISIPIL